MVLAKVVVLREFRNQFPRTQKANGKGVKTQDDITTMVLEANTN